MADYSELDALRDVHDALSKLADDAARARVLAWATGKFTDGSLAVPGRGLPPEAPRTTKQAGAKRRRPKKSRATSGDSGKKRKSSVTAPTLDKQLDLRPSGKESFVDMATRLKPSTIQEKCVVAVYYLTATVELDAIGINQVYTCFKRASWRVPADLRNALQLTASRKGWLDTQAMDAIRITPAGENLVEHDLQSED